MVLTFFILFAWCFLYKTKAPPFRYGAVALQFCLYALSEVLGLEVPHAHIHLIPMQSEKDMLFSNPKLQLPEEEMKEIADKIYAEFKKL